MSYMHAAEAAQIASAAFTAVAAGASWAAVTQTRRQWRREREPELHLQITETRSGGQGRLELHIENSGGMAKAVSYAAASDIEACLGFVGPNLMLQSGDGVTIWTHLTPRPEGVPVKGVVIAWDRSSRYAHAWSDSGEHKHWRRRNWPTQRPKGGDWIFAQFFPDVPLTSMPFVNSGIVERRDRLGRTTSA
jgi:hypothetical protein